MPYIIGTAGHIDHGKTSLVKALTGQDTDRLKEEKERGISIDLGFAYLDLPDGTRAGVVDVPGHERFIHNMLAGAHGIDLVLFTVAADDGVMPQTEEHLDILHLLGVQRAIFVITKCDLASETRLREVDEEIQVLISGTSLENSPTIPFSFVTGQGLDALRSQVVQTLQSGEKPQPPGHFRLPVDRVFVLQGHGLIVTGTALSGEVKVGDWVRCLPGQQRLRVRSLQAHNQPVETGVWGQRLALNLSGHEKPSIARGHVICHESMTLTSDRFDAFLEVRPMAEGGIKNHQRVKVHLGTAERLAKLFLLGPAEKERGAYPGAPSRGWGPAPLIKVGPKESAYCQLALSEPVQALRGDRFVIRDETAQRTLGGGGIIHPWPKKHKRNESDLQQTLEWLHRGEIARLAEIFIDESDDFALPIGPVSQFLNLREDDVRKRVEALATIRVLGFDGEKLYTTEKKWRHVKEHLLGILRTFHGAHPLAPGMDMEELRDKLPYHTVPRVFRELIGQLEAEKATARDGSLLRLPDHKIRLQDEEKSLVDSIKTLLGTSPFTPPDLKEVEQEIGIERARLNEVIRVMEREGSVVRVAPELYFLADGLDRLKVALCKHLSEKGDISPADFRDLFGTSRKYTIPLLEYFDRKGITIRVGDVRRLKVR
jgi:selenocysteine-specific elongation factor